MKNYFKIICYIIIIILLATSCTFRKSELVKVKVISTIELPRGYVSTFQSRLMTEDSTVYYLFTNVLYEPGDKIMVKIKNNKVIL